MRSLHTEICNIFHCNEYVNTELYKREVHRRGQGFPRSCANMWGQFVGLYRWTSRAVFVLLSHCVWFYFHHELLTCIISPPLEISVTGRNGLVYAPSLWIKAPNWLWCREIYIWNIYHLYLILLMRCTELRSIISLLLNNNCTSLTLFGRMKFAWFQIISYVKSTMEFWLILAFIYSNIFTIVM